MAEISFKMKALKWRLKEERTTKACKLDTVKKGAES